MNWHIAWARPKGMRPSQSTILFMYNVHERFFFLESFNNKKQGPKNLLKCFLSEKQLKG